MGRMVHKLVSTLWRSEVSLGAAATLGPFDGKEQRTSSWEATQVGLECGKLSEQALSSPTWFEE